MLRITRILKNRPETANTAPELWKSALDVDQLPRRYPASDFRLQPEPWNSATPLTKIQSPIPQHQPPQRNQNRQNQLNHQPHNTLPPSVTLLRKCVMLVKKSKNSRPISHRWGTEQPFPSTVSAPTAKNQSPRQPSLFQQEFSRRKKSRGTTTYSLPLHCPTA